MRNTRSIKDKSESDLTKVESLKALIESGVASKKQFVTESMNLVNNNNNINKSGGGSGIKAQ